MPIDNVLIVYYHIGMINPFKYLYGPVYSWRLGRSLGIDPLSHPEKICNMNCVYCQLGLTAHLTNERKEFVAAQDIVDEISRLPRHFVDYLTFSGRGEPTLAKNLGDMIRRIKACRHEHVAVITNSSLMHLQEVRQDLNEADFVLAKLDAANQNTFAELGGKGLDFQTVLKGLREFRYGYKGKFALQIMLIDNNLNNVAALASAARDLDPDEVQLNTPLRPCAVGPIKPGEMRWAKKFFDDMPVVTVWDAPHQEYSALDQEATIKRHGNYLKKSGKVVEW